MPGRQRVGDPIQQATGSGAGGVLQPLLVEYEAQLPPRRSVTAAEGQSTAPVRGLVEFEIGVDGREDVTARSGDHPAQREDGRRTPQVRGNTVHGNLVRPAGESVHLQQRVPFPEGERRRVLHTPVDVEGQQPDLRRGHRHVQHQDLVYKHDSADHRRRTPKQSRWSPAHASDGQSAGRRERPAVASRRPARPVREVDVLARLPRTRSGKLLRGTMATSPTVAQSPTNHCPQCGHDPRPRRPITWTATKHPCHKTRRRANTPVISATRRPAVPRIGVGKGERCARSHARAVTSGADRHGPHPFRHCGTVTVYHRQTPRKETTMSPADKPSAENTDLLESANTAAVHAADAVKTAAAKAEDAIEASVEQIRELNEQAITAARAAGQRALDAYQAALESVVGAEKKLAAGSQLDWFTTLVSTQAEFTQRLGTIFLTAAREQLK